MTISLVTLCASHITELSRLRHFENLLKSFIKQTVKCKMYISISCDSQPELLKSLKDLILYIETQTNLIKIHVQGTKKSQFEHYNYLVQTLTQNNHKKVWCLFTDDDDYLAPTRNEHYIKLVETLSDTEVCAMIPTMLYSSWDNSKINESILNLYLSERKNLTKVFRNGREYVTYCVRLDILQSFCKFMGYQGKLETKQCDVVFGTLLQNLCTTVSRPSVWLYAYNQSRSHIRISHEHGLRYYINNYDITCLNKLAKYYELKAFDKCPPVFSKECYLAAVNTAEQKQRKRNSIYKSLAFKLFLGT